MANAAKNPNDPLLEFPGYLMRRASVTFLADLNERLAALELRHTDSSLLQLIRANPGIRQSDAGRALEIKRANMVPLIARLEKRGLIERTPIDGRSQAINLSRSGRALAKKALAVVRSTEQALLNKVPSDLRPSVLPILLALWRGEDASADGEPDNIKFLNAGTNSSRC